MKQMTDKEFIDSFDEAVLNGQICVYYQPKFNHSTGRLIGAEALMRWNHPEYGLQSPLFFIPVLEKYGLIYRADLCVFEQICQFLQKCPSYLRIPISFNVSRYDLFRHDYISDLEIIRRRYDVPVKYLQAEITESSAIGGLKLVSSAIEKFHEAGYLVAMDDFGSGYSSLSVLKSLPVDILKLDLRFLLGEEVSGRGGIILVSCVQMAKWLETQVIAEGVETIEQADFLKSIGCNYVQGYLYSKPISKENMLQLLKNNRLEETKPAFTFIRGLRIRRFWNPDSLETVFFNNFVGAAAIFSYRDGLVELLRVNEKYYKEFGMGLTEKDVLSVDFSETLEEKDRKVYFDTIEKAIKTEEEEVCETWRIIQSGCCGIERICIRSYMRVIGRTETQTILYVMIQNITAEKNQHNNLLKEDKTLRFAIEQANVYAWEYIVDTKEMHPCFRCMRDLGLPSIVRNYPEPVIESGIFPQDYADMYRDWHKQIANGVKSLEAIIPLTVARVPFHVRYTTEFDESGKPLKAFGSATLVVDDKVDSN